MKLKDILSKEEIEEYHNQWTQFEDKKIYEEKLNTHSSNPIISKVFVFREQYYPILRAKVFQKKLREFDPYFVTKKYANPFWHIQHYIMVVEQIYHAGSNLIRDNSKNVVRDTLENATMKVPIFWDNKHKHISIEMILENIPKNKENYLFMENAFFTFYNDKKNSALARIYFKTYINKRSYLRDLEDLKNGLGDIDKKQILNSLIRKIEMQDIKHNLWSIDKRQNLSVTKDEIISELNSGKIPENKLYDFFSLWDQ